MSDELGMVGYGDRHEHVFLARDMASPRDYSEATAQKIDTEVKRFIDNAYGKARELIVKHRAELETIAKGLLEYETLEAKHILEIMEHGEMKNPPVSPKPPSLPTEMENEKEPTAEASRPDEGELPGGLAPAGA
jgi:cell division protease FtsH